MPIDLAQWNADICLVTEGHDRRGMNGQSWHELKRCYERKEGDVWDWAHATYEGAEFLRYVAVDCVLERLNEKIPLEMIGPNMASSEVTRAALQIFCDEWFPSVLQQYRSDLLLLLLERENRFLATEEFNCFDHPSCCAAVREIGCLARVARLVVPNATRHARHVQALKLAADKTCPGMADRVERELGAERYGISKLSLHDLRQIAVRDVLVPAVQMRYDFDVSTCAGRCETCVKTFCELCEFTKCRRCRSICPCGDKDCFRSADEYNSDDSDWEL
jgi:hypothetical protein